MEYNTLPIKSFTQMRFRPNRHALWNIVIVLVQNGSDHDPLVNRLRSELQDVMATKEKVSSKRKDSEN